MDLVLYGSGVQGKRTLEKIKLYNGLLKVDYFCDSNPENVGKHIEDIPIISTKTLLELSQGNKVCVIICSMYYEEIIHSLDDNGILDNINDVYISIGANPHIFPFGSMYQSLNPLFDMRNQAGRLSNHFNFSSLKYEPVIIGGFCFELEVMPYNAQPMQLLEHVYDRLGKKATTSVIAFAGKTLFVSNDMCSTFIEYPINLEQFENISRCFTTFEGYHIIMTTGRGVSAKAKRFIILDRNYNEVSSSVFSETKWPWHGTFSIDQSSTGTIIYAEYPSSSDYHEASVYRSVNNGLSWDKVYSLPASMDMTFGDIRHFHTCMADPYIPGRWYISAGDREYACDGLWISNDDGIMWERIDHGEVFFLSDNLSDNDKKGITGQLYRMTSAIITQNSIFYINDSNYQDQNPQTLCLPCFIRADKHSPYKVDVLCKVGISSIRSLVKIGEDFFVAFTENKNNQDKIDIFLGNTNSEEIKHVGGIPSGQSSTGTRSTSSIADNNGVFVINLSDCIGEGVVMAVVKCTIQSNVVGQKEL